MSLRILFLFQLINSVFCANILGVFIFPSFSHQVAFRPIWRELSLRGHQVTVLTPDPINDPKLVNLTEIDVHYTYDLVKQARIDLTLSKDVTQFELLTNLNNIVDTFTEVELNNPKFQQLLSDKNRTFDLILIEFFHPVLYGLSARFRAPIIGVSSLGLTLPGHDAVGNPTHPSLHPDIFMNFYDNRLNLLQKIQSCFHNIWYRLYYNWVFLPRADKMARKYFGENIPYIGDLERNVSLMFMNTNPLIFTPRPNVPAVIELGFLHIRPPQPLAHDLKKILDESQEGVVYFSLGSNVKSINLPETLRKTIIDALSELPYKILWKWESDRLPGKPDNVLIRKWFPQQDILSHPNVKVFVTQGGLQSIEEAITGGVPMVAMPFMADQPMNVYKLRDLGIGVLLNPATLTKNQLKQSIITIAENRKYRDRVKTVRDLLLDQPMSGLERAIWWSEYVIRHKGARHLRSLEVDTSLFHYYLVDVFLLLISITTITIYLFYKLLQFFKLNCSPNKLKTA